MVLLKKWFTADLSFIKSVLDRFRNNSQHCINKRVWICDKNICIVMTTNVTASWTISSLVMKLGSIITNQRLNGRECNGKIHNCPPKIIFTVIWKEKRQVKEQYHEHKIHKNKQCVFQWDAYWHATLKSRSKHPVQLLPNSVVLLQDNVRQHAAVYTAATPPEAQVWSKDFPFIHPYFCFFGLPLILYTQRRIEGPSVLLGTRTERRDAYVLAHFSSENLVFLEHQEACATIDKVQSKERELYWKMMLTLLPQIIV